MNEGGKRLLLMLGGKLLDYGVGRLTAPRHRIEDRIQHIDRLIQVIPADGDEPAPVSIGSPESPKKGHETENTREDMATGCLPCAVGHFSTSSGLLKEAVRFKAEGMTSSEILDRIAAALEEQNALEREDLSPDKIQRLHEWEKPIAEEALSQSRQLRHRLESIQTIEELEQLAADTRTYYLKLSRQWYRGRFGHLGAGKTEAIAQRVG